MSEKNRAKICIIQIKVVILHPLCEKTSRGMLKTKLIRVMAS